MLPLRRYVDGTWVGESWNTDVRHGTVHQCPEVQGSDWRNEDTATNVRTGALARVTQICQVPNLEMLCGLLAPSQNQRGRAEGPTAFSNLLRLCFFRSRVACSAALHEKSRPGLLKIARRCFQLIPFWQLAVGGAHLGCHREAPHVA